ncbi:MAG: ribosome recycling factor [Candidatus Levyibacteriota bacterium]
MDITAEVKQRMQRSFDSLRADFATVRTGKASPSLVENIVIKAYGGTTPLRVMELATIHVADVHTLVITPFDNSIIGEIERGIADAKVGLNPIVDGTLVRINLPPLSEERRKEFVKLIHQKAEGGKVMIRQARHDGMEDAKKLEKEVTEDEVVRLEKEIQRLTDDFIGQIDDLSKQKEEELMKV